MRFIKNFTLIIIIFILIITGCNYQDLTTTPPVRPQNVEAKAESEEKIIIPQGGGTLNLSMRKPTTLNPILNTDYYTNQTLKLIFDDLLKIDENLKIQPSIAERWEFSQDSTVLSIWLNKNYKWHDDTPITARDIVFTLNAISKTPDDSTYKSCLRNIKSYSADPDDDSQVKITFKQPFSGALYTLCFPVIPEHYYKEQYDMSSQNNMQPLGSGRYKFVDLTQDRELTLKKNESHPNSPYIDNIIVKFTPDNETDLYSFEQNIIDAIATDSIEWGRHTGANKTNIKEYTTNYYDFIGFNFKNPLFTEKSIRQAIACVMPKDRIITELYSAHATKTDNPLNPSNWLYSESAKKYPASVEMAKALLHTGGFTDSDNNNVIEKIINEIKVDASFKILVNTENDERIKIAAILIEQLAKIGIQAEIQELPFDEYVEKLNSYDFDSFIGGWELSLIPDYTFAFHSTQIDGGRNYINYADPQMDTLLEKAFLSEGDENILSAYNELQEYIAEELPYVSIVFRNSAILTNQRVIGEIKPVINDIYSNLHEWFIYDEVEETEETEEADKTEGANNG